MGTDYSSAIAGLVGLGLVLSAMVAFVFSRPSDLPSVTPDPR